MTLRTRLFLVLCGLLGLSVGATGAILIHQSAANTTVELEAKHHLLAETRAFALRDNLEILKDELKRIAALPQVEPADESSVAEGQVLEAAHRNSVLYDTAVLLIGGDGRCLWSVPDRGDCPTTTFADRAWFRAARDEPTGHYSFIATDDSAPGQTFNVVESVMRRGHFAGALVGVIALGRDKLITPVLSKDLPPLTDLVLVRADQRVLYRLENGRPWPDAHWGAAIARAARGDSGTLRADVAGEDSLFAFVPVGAGTPFSLVFRWPWWSLTGGLRRQAWTLVGILGLAIVLAAGSGLALAAYLTRPLRALSDAAHRIGAGQYPPEVELPRPGNGEEVDSLVQAFDRMGRSLRARENEVRQAAAELEERVADRTQELVRAQQALVEVERFAAMGKTAAAIAHELKNAMGGLGMAVELILEDAPRTPRVDRLRRQVLAEVHRLRYVTDALLSFSRKPRLERSLQDLDVVVHRAVDLLGDLIIDRSADVAVSASGAVPLSCDGSKVQSVVMNLVRNAVEAGRKVRVRVGAEDGEAWVEVADDGPGLSEEVRQHLFEPFFTTKPNGTGLGLPTASRFVEAHGGRIEAEASADLGGALFRVRLPQQAPIS